MQYKVFFKSNIAKLFYIYTLGNIFILLNFQGIYWDDWTLYNVDNESMMDQFRMNGGLLAGYMHSLLLPIGNGIFIYRILVFITFFMSGIFIYKILSQHISITKEASFWISLIYLTIPLNSAKIALINAPAIFLLFIFFIAFYLLTKYISKSKSTWLRISILSLFFISFVMNSLLVFYAIILLYILYSIITDSKTNEYPHKIIYIIKIFVLKYSDFIILPIIFYIVKSIYFVPSGPYATYNQVSFDFEKIINLIDNSFIESIYDPILLSIQTSLTYWYISLMIFITLFLLIQNKTIENKKIYYYMTIFILGALFYLLAVFPYAVVDKPPRLTGWESRHQILIPLGLAFILYSIISIFSKLHKNVPALMFLFLITIFTIQNMYNGYRYMKDWYYQVALEENFKKSKLIQEHTTFIARVTLNNVLANGRHISFYEQNGRMRKVFGNDKRLMVEQKKDIGSYKKYKSYKQYNFSSWEYQEPIYIKITKNNLLDNQAFYLFKMLYYQISDQQVFRTMAKKLIIIEIRDNKDV